MRRRIAVVIIACIALYWAIGYFHGSATASSPKPVTQGIWLYYQSNQVDSMPLNCIAVNGGGFECYMVGVGGGHAFKD